MRLLVFVGLLSLSACKIHQTHNFSNPPTPSSSSQGRSNEGMQYNSPQSEGSSANSSYDTPSSYPSNAPSNTSEGAEDSLSDSEPSWGEGSQGEGN